MRDTFYSGYNSNRGPSVSIWGTLPPTENQWMDNLVMLGGLTPFDDFTNFGGTVTTKVGSLASSAGMYKSYEETSCTLKMLDDDTNATTGVIELLLAGGADNDEVNMEAGYGNAGMFIITAGKKAWFEARVWAKSVTDDDQSWFVGLAEKGLAATDGMFSDADPAVQASVDCVGFRVLEADGDELDVVHGVNGTAPTELIDGVQALTVSTWYKVGFYCDGTRVYFYVNGVQQSTSVLTTATNFPDGILLTPYISVKAESSVAATDGLRMDWWGAACEV